MFRIMIWVKENHFDEMFPKNSGVHVKSVKGEAHSKIAVFFFWPTKVGYSPK